MATVKSIIEKFENTALEQTKSVIKKLDRTKSKTLISNKDQSITKDLDKFVEDLIKASLAEEKWNISEVIKKFKNFKDRAKTAELNNENIKKNLEELENILIREVMFRRDFERFNKENAIASLKEIQKNSSDNFLQNQTKEDELQQKPEVDTKFSVEYEPGQKLEVEDFFALMSKDERQKFENLVSQTGMVPKHVAFASMNAKANDFVQIFRPINKSAAQKLELHGYIGKGLGTKGKSSYFYPIDGDVPYDTTLSYLGKADENESIEEKEQRLTKIKKFHHKNDQALEDAEKEYKKHKLLLDKISQENLNEESKTLLKKTVENFNEDNLEVKIPKQIQYGKEFYTLFYAKDENKKTVWDDTKNAPLFFIDLGESGLWKVGEGAGKFEKYQLPENFEKKEVEIIAYRRIEIKNDKIVETKKAITADYDELTFAAKRIFPFENNDEILIPSEDKKYQRLSKNDIFKALKSCDEEQKTQLKKQILQHLLEDEKDRFGYLAYDKKMGVATPVQYSSKAVQSLDFEDASSHAPDTGNPFPDEFTKANYPTFLPDGSIKILHGEKEICDFINEQINKGYPMDINPKWGWKRDEKTGDFYVPKQKDRFDWKKIESNLEDLAKKIERLNVVGNRSSIESNSSISDLEEKYLMQKMIYDKYVEFLRLEQKPKLIYSDEKNHVLGIEFEEQKLSKNDLRSFKDEICEMHRLDRIQKSVDAFNKIIELENKFTEKYQKASIAGGLCHIKESRIKELQETLEESKSQNQKPKTVIHPTETLHQIDFSKQIYSR